jgi:hypothetical protein
LDLLPLLGPDWRDVDGTTNVTEGQIPPFKRLCAGIVNFLDSEKNFRDRSSEAGSRLDFPTHLLLEVLSTTTTCLCQRSSRG